MKSSIHQSTLHLSFKIKCCVDRLRPPSNSDIARYLWHFSKGPTEHVLDMSPAQASLGPRKTRLGATVCFSRLELTLHGSLVLSLAADVVVLPLHTRH